MTGFEPATTGATVRPNVCDEDVSGRLGHSDNELPVEPNQGSDHKDP
jgi:hypothetical protein